MSNAANMAKWMRFNLNNGTTQNGKPMFNMDSFLQIFEASVTSLLFCYTSQCVGLSRVTPDIRQIRTYICKQWKSRYKEPSH